MDDQHILNCFSLLFETLDFFNKGGLDVDSIVKKSAIAT